MESLSTELSQEIITFTPVNGVYVTPVYVGVFSPMNPQMEEYYGQYKLLSGSELTIAAHDVKVVDTGCQLEVKAGYFSTQATPESMAFNGLAIVNSSFFSENGVQWRSVSNVSCKMTETLKLVIMNLTAQDVVIKKSDNLAWLVSNIRPS